MVVRVDAILATKMLAGGEVGHQAESRGGTVVRLQAEPRVSCDSCLSEGEHGKGRGEKPEEKLNMDT